MGMRQASFFSFEPIDLSCCNPIETRRRPLTLATGDVERPRAPRARPSIKGILARAVARPWIFTRSMAVFMIHAPRAQCMDTVGEVRGPAVRDVHHATSPRCAAFCCLPWVATSLSPSSAMQ